MTNDRMIDLMAGDARLRRRLDAYADARLTPDLVATSRMRARVLAVAHRRADLARADAALTVVPSLASPGHTGRSTTRPRTAASRLRRPIAAILAAAIAVGAGAGATLAAMPGGALYGSRLWLETLTLPSDPSGRAVAELGRLAERLREAESAARAGDIAGAEAALAAYEAIVESASDAAIAAQDEVAVAILETGVGRNVEVLQALALRLPDEASAAIARAVERAIDRALQRSERAIERIESNGPRPNAGGSGPGKPVGPAAKPTREPTPTPKPTKQPNAGGQGGGGGGSGPKETPKPAPTPKETPPGHG